MSIQVYERFDNSEITEPSTSRGCQLSPEDRGELWETITWDFMQPTWRNFQSAKWQLKCDFRMPAHGVLRFMHPNKDEAVEFVYDTPSCWIPHYTPGVIKQKSFTESLKKEWEALPAEWIYKIGKMTLKCTKDIVDAIESNILGELYLYRATELSIN